MTGAGRCGIAILALAAVVAPVTPSIAQQLPAGFEYLRTVDPTIEQDIRYAGNRNFTGARLPGYGAAECVLTRRAAIALRDVQSSLRSDGLGLKVFDCYRPARAVAAMVRWVDTPADRRLREGYHPRVEKARLIPTYIARRSSHSRGSAVDVTLLSLPAGTAPVTAGRPVCRPPEQHVAGEGERDMGTPFDCFDPASRTDAPGLGADQRGNRKTLVRAMRRHGFVNYPGEWWHFRLEAEPYPDTHFDFPIVPAGATGNGE